MLALTVQPGVAGSAELEDVRAVGAADAGDGEVVVATSAVGVCGTDAEITAGEYGAAPEGRTRLVIGHEAVGTVVVAPAGSTHAPGDVVVPIVRLPDPVPCESCAVGEWDMCSNGLYTEHGITGADGFARERFVIAAGHVVAVPASLHDAAVLIEPASVVAKAWEQIDRIGSRRYWAPRIALVTGAGPIGLLAALLATQRGLETHVVDLVTDGPKPQLVSDLGAHYHVGAVADACPTPDIVVECTGVGSVVLDAIAHNSRTGVVCLTGLSSGSRSVDVDAAALNRRLVLENDVVFGSVNANRRHYEGAVAALADADREWLDRLITRRVAFRDWADALARKPDDVKVVIDVARPQ